MKDILENRIYKLERLGIYGIGEIEVGIRVMRF